MLNTLNMYHPVCLQLVLCAALCKTLYSANSPICGFASRYVLQNLEPPSGLKFLNRAAVNALRPPDMFYGLYRRPLTPVIFLAEISRDKKCWPGPGGRVVVQDCIVRPPPGAALAGVGSASLPRLQPRQSSPHLHLAPTTRWMQLVSVLFYY